MYDVIIIGGGPAGLSTAIYCARAKLKTLVLDKGESALKKAHVIENYFGIESVEGEKLLEIGKKQAIKFGAEIKNEEVLSIIPFSEYYEVETAKEKYKGKYIVLAVGTRRAKPEIKNIEKFEGNGISYCAVCDAFFFKNKIVGVIGNKDYAIKEALEVKAHAKKVYILTNGNKLELSPEMEKHLNEFEIIDKKITSFYGDEKLEGVEFEDGEKLSLQGVFIAIDAFSPISLASKLGLQVEKGIIVADKNQFTGIPRIYAVGDCTNKEKQVGVAVGEGIKAALSIIREIRSSNP